MSTENNRFSKYQNTCPETLDFTINVQQVSSITITQMHVHCITFPVHVWYKRYSIYMKFDWLLYYPVY